jgi:hypothetical protein
VKPALAAFLERLGHTLAGFDPVPLLNSRGDECGEIVALK